MDTISRHLEHWRERAYGEESSADIANVIYHEIDDLIKALRIADRHPEAITEVKIAIGDILAMCQEICTKEKLPFFDTYMFGCQRAAERCKEKIDGSN